jgi:hypothetical protein
VHARQREPLILLEPRLDARSLRREHLSRIGTGRVCNFSQPRRAPRAYWMIAVMLAYRIEVRVLLAACVAAAGWTGCGPSEAPRTKGENVAKVKLGLELTSAEIREGFSDILAPARALHDRVRTAVVRCVGLVSGTSPILVNTSPVGEKNKED